MVLQAGFSLLRVDIGELTAVRSAIGRFQDAIERLHGVVLSAECTLPRRRAGNKPAVRVGEGVHEESKPLK